MSGLDCDNCPAKEQPDCCHARPEEVQSANADDRAWLLEVFRNERNRQDASKNAMRMGYGSLTGFKVEE